jgi:hypothetical protein
VETMAALMTERTFRFLICTFTEYLRHFRLSNVQNQQFSISCLPSVKETDY